MSFSRWCLLGFRSATPSVRITQRRGLALLLAIGLGGGLLGCHDLTGSQALPAGTPAPSFYKNATGALGMRNAAVFAFVNLLPGYIVNSGLLSDELTDLSTITGASQGVQLQNGGAVTDPVDERILPEQPYGSNTAYGTDQAYTQLQGARTAILQALGQLAAYDSTAQDIAILKPAVDSVLRGELYALYGLDEVMLADLFCSGIPLSTLDFQKDFTYRAGSTTVQVYQDALAKFDTALALSGDSARIQNLARVGQGRAYLDLGQAAVAADDVALVPTGFQYQVQSTWSLGGGASPDVLNAVATVSNDEGGNGLPFLTSGDPRTADTSVTFNISFTTYTAGFPKKYTAGLGGAFTAPVTVADGVEARLIQAEAALHAGDVTTWLTTLNQLRTTGTFNGADTVKVAADTLVDTLGYTGCTAVGSCDDNGYQTSVNYASLVLLTSYPITVPDPSPEIATCRAVNPNRTFSCINPQVNVYGSNVVPVVPLQIHFKWQAGTGGVSGLAPLPDPGLSSPTPDSARVVLLFQERASWLYLTGHRQGDLRRLLRQYSRYWPDESQAYPNGTYLGLGAGNYGTNVNAPIPGAEYINPLFHGCVDRAP